MSINKTNTKNTNNQPTGSLTDRDWQLLLQRIKVGKCTPFLGAGASFGALPLGGEISEKWADKYKYPLSDRHDLARVAQYMAVEYDPMFPKEAIVEDWFTDIKPPDFTEKDEPHGVLASLPLPVYMTTNYDDFMFQALEKNGKKPQRDVCQWNSLLQTHEEKTEGIEPSIEKPFVFHLHGQHEIPESLVLTEDDYLDFLVNLSKDKHLIPLRIQRALAGTSLLFIGYRLTDWSFRVLFRLVTSAESSLRRISVTVQLPPQANGTAESDMQQKYLTSYFGSRDIRVYWGTAREFAAELSTRWKEANNGK